MLYHVVFQICLTVQGQPEHCQSQMIVDTTEVGLISCYASAKNYQNVILAEVNKQVEAEHKGELQSSQVKTQCLDYKEAEVLMKKLGPDGLFISGQK